MGLLILILGLVAFIGAHVFVTFRDRRAALIARLGTGPYRGLFVLVSIIGVVLIGYGFGLYRSTGWIEVWSPSPRMRIFTVLLMWPACVMVAAAYFRGEIKQLVDHPMLVGVKTWAVAHLLSNGDLGSIILFGSVLAWAVYDRITLKRRSDPGGPPFPQGGTRNDIIAVVAGTALYLVLGLLFHPYVVGIRVF